MQSCLQDSNDALAQEARIHSCVMLRRGATPLICLDIAYSEK